MKRLVSAVSLLLTATLVSYGCSFATVRGPSRTRIESSYGAPRCTSSRAAPIFDTVLAGVLLVDAAMAGYAALASDTHPQRRVDMGRIASTFAVAGLGFVASRWWAGSRIEACREERARHDGLVRDLIHYTSPGIAPPPAAVVEEIVP